MTDSPKRSRLLAALLGAVEMASLFLAAVALLSMGGGELDRLLAAFLYLLLLPAAAGIGILLGIRCAGSPSRWGFARFRQVILSVTAAVLLLGLQSALREMGIIGKHSPRTDAFVAASSNDLVEALRDSQPDGRVRAAEALVQRGNPDAGELILPMLRDESSFVRGRAAVLLGRLRNERAVDGIIGLLDDPDHGTQLDAVRSLGEIGDQRAVAPLLSVLDRPNFGGVVAEALARIGDRRAVGPLIDFLEDGTRADQVQARSWVLESLEKLSGQEYGNDIVGWRRWFEAEGRDQYGGAPGGGTTGR